MNTFLTILLVIAIIAGIVIVIQALRSKDREGDGNSLEYKDGLPILPREERIPEKQEVPAPTQTAPDQTPPSQTVPNPTQTDGATAEPDQKSARDLAEETKADALSSLAKVASQNPSDGVPKEPEKPVQAPTKPAEQPTEQPTEDVEINIDTPEQVQTPHAKRERFSDPSHEFTQNSPVLDRHLSEQQAFDQNNDPLLNAKDTVTIVITPKDQYNGLSGRTVLEIVKAYGLKYGVMNMYHRYEREDGTGDLWFSMLGVTYDGVQAFDLNTLVDGHFVGLSLFLSLPHPHALRGFDSMVSVAQMIAKDINADVHDEEGYVLDDNYLAKIRSQVANYR